MAHAKLQIPTESTDEQALEEMVLIVFSGGIRREHGNGV
jgi:hypothetical protein